MGTERTGPDLTDVGNRQPSLEWNLVHLFNPRIVVSESVMPAYPWLFEVKSAVGPDDVAVNVPEAFLGEKGGQVVAKEEALQLVAYLQSLKQTELPSESGIPAFLYRRQSSTEGDAGTPGAELDGALLYASNCQSCHQEDGKGLPGAFPSLVGSSIVSGDDIEIYVDIIMNGYDAHPEYAAMPGIGTMMAFTEHEVTAIINHERSSWGNNGTPVTVEEVKKIMDMLGAGISAN